jgi:glutathione S-transferase
MRVLQGGSAVQSLHASLLLRPLSVASLTASAHLPSHGSLISAVSCGSLIPSSSSRVLSSFSSGSALSIGERRGGTLGQKSHSKFLVRRKSQLVCMAASTTAPVEVLVKAAVGHPDQLGDCPFSQRVLLTLEEKGIPYEAKYIDTSNKPAWFLEANPEGKVPVIKDDGKWVADSDVITEILEQKFPEPSLAGPAPPVGGKLFGAFVQFLVSKDPSDGKEQALLDELKAVDTYLKENGPYLNGEKISAPDLALAPKLYHLKIALGHYKKWSIPAEFTSLNSYIDTLHSRESFVKTKAPDSTVVKGWESKVLGA